MAQNLFRGGEAGHQVFKSARLLEGEFEAAGNQAFGDPRWTKQKNALAAERRQQAEAYRVAAFKESFSSAALSREILSASKCV